MGREVSKSCMDGLVTEMVSSYCTRFYSNKPELAARRIEAIGYQVGHQLSERYGSPSFTPYQTPHYLFHFILADSILGLIRYTIERPRFTDHLEAIKFICKDFWSELFKKQIDNLKTNHRVSSVNYFYFLFVGFFILNMFFFSFRVRLCCKIISFHGYHECRGMIYRLRMEWKILKVKVHKQWACIAIFLVGL
jgi:hypothetical protein